jgi:hypothetical protein
MKYLHVALWITCAKMFHKLCKSILYNNTAWRLFHKLCKSILQETSAFEKLIKQAAVLWILKDWFHNYSKITRGMNLKFSQFINIL